MSWFRRRQAPPDPLAWGSSFAAQSDDPGLGADLDAERPRSGGPMRRLLSVMLLLAAVLLVGGLIWGAVGLLADDDAAPGTTVRVKIPAGASSERIAHILARAGVVHSESVFRARLKLHGDGDAFRAGSYVMKTGSSYDTVVRRLERGPAAAPTFDLTIPEGQRLEETAALIDRLRDQRHAAGERVVPAFTGAEYLTAARAQRPPVSVKAPSGTRSMEGMLFPATYQLRHTATAQDLVRKQREAFDDTLSGIDMARAARANLTPYDVVIIASLIEREAKLDKERPLIAAVIWNRLKAGEPLGIDASNQYGVYRAGSDEFWESALTQSQLAADGPYNVRTRAGLPPTPIAEPGLASLEAAAAPAKVDYRYYVANPDGSGEHFFTSSYDEFLRHPFQGG